MSIPRTADKEVGNGRWLKALQFAEAASLHFDNSTETSESPDSYVTLAVHSGIASSDTICISKLGVYSANGSHAEATALLRKADPEAATHLGRLLSLKTKAGYSHSVASTKDVQTAARAHKRLLEIAQALR